MKIKYVFRESPDEAITTDTVLALADLLPLLRSKPTQEEFDRIILERFLRYKEEGYVLHYEIIKP